VASIFALKQHHVKNLYGYIFENGPYINRVFVTHHHVVSSDDPLFIRLVSDASFEDRRGNYPDFDQSLSRQLNLPSNRAERARYKQFIDRYRNISAKYNDRDLLARAINKLAFDQNEANKHGKPFDPTITDNLSEKDRRIEDVILGFANYYSSCGTISETIVALLRGIGFRTRLVRVAHKPDKIVANHVFVEYYSNNFKKWVMLDPLENFAPRERYIPLSAFEFFSTRDREAILRDSGIKSYPYASETDILWFNRNGPIRDIFYYTWSRDVRRKLVASLK
tara:strand:- start:303 stop:1142 length:840 start_codon:yes stop_codon:yes gene_type:complete